LFEYDGSVEFGFRLLQGPYYSSRGGHYALVVGDFATAYRLLERVMICRCSSGLNIEIPQTSTSHFEPILIADMYDQSADFYIPDTKFHHQIEHLLCAGLLDTDGPMKEELWPSMLKCSGSELNLIDRSMVFSYVMDEIKARSLDFIYITGIMWLGDIFERGERINGTN
jgi:hypothetical protein